MNRKLKVRKIVVVDNEASKLDLIARHFVLKGYEVTTFKNPLDTLSAAASSTHHWDALLTDFNFTNISKNEFENQIHTLLPNLPIIPLTQFKTTESTEASTRSNHDQLSFDHINFQQIQIAIEKNLQEKPHNGSTNETRKTSKTIRPHQNSLIGKSPRFIEALEVSKRVAPSSANILITGESGTGKEMFAKFIHQQSKYSSGPFVAINCSAIPESLLESELFGHAKGSFTNAHDRRTGLFEEAENGTLFLDEIGDLSLSLQAKLLRVLQEKQIRRVGENNYIPINCRIISATHKDLPLEIKEGRFREDLFFRLEVIPLTVPPLRERHEDILSLAEFFLKKFSAENESVAKEFSNEAIEFLLHHHWRGNVRELENAVERAVVLSTSHTVTLDDFMPNECGTLLPSDGIENPSESNHFTLACESQLPTLDEVIHKYIEFAVERRGGARDKTAKEIGIDRKTLYRKMSSDYHREHGVSSQHK